MTTKPRVYVTRRVADKALEMVRAECAMTLWDGDVPVPREVLLREVADCEGLLCMLTDKIDDELLDAAPKLKVVSNMAVGFDNIDAAAVSKRGIPAGNTPGVLTETCADMTLALLMAAARRISEGERYVRAGKWQTWDPNLLLGSDVYGATLGIVGLGRIGQALARRARGFNMRLLYHGGKAEAAHELGAEQRSLDDLLREADFVSVHVPLKPDTYHLIGEHQLKLMKPTAVLINTARGGVVDPKALYHALKDGTMAYAALDVTEPEPIPPDDPLLTLENCLIVPHIASASVATRTRMATMAAENLLAGLRGERLPHCINPQVYGSTS
jgi:lactate dehydrogenase-like 2-hydroxyacid dehydrogenase